MNKSIISMLAVSAVCAAMAGCGASAGNSIQDSALSAAESSMKADEETLSTKTEVSASPNDSGEISHYTDYADYTPVKAAPNGLQKGTRSNILVAYFSRSGNTSVSGVDAVSSASLSINSDGTTEGNARQMAEWIADETGGDLYLIQTEYTYPADYDQTVSVGEGQDRDGIHPALISPELDISQYDAVFLVYPTWHFTLNAPTRSFLDQYDLTGKTIYAFDTHAGSRFADTIKEIQEAEPGATVVEGLAVSQNDITDSESEIREKANEFLQGIPEPSSEQTSATSEESVSSATEKSTNSAAEEESEMTMTIGDTPVSVTWENNESALALKELAASEPLTIQMSMYGGFEQVGDIGSSLPRNDVQTITTAGDIVLYSGDKIVVFYGSNSWAYTRLGHITDKSAEEMSDLLSNGDSSITLSLR